MRRGRRAFPVMCLAVGVLALAGCATTRPPSTVKPIASVADLEGTWAGTIEFGAGEQPCTLAIEPGGRATVTGRSITASGQVSVRDGKATYSFPARSDGAVTLYDTGGQRQLNLRGTSGVFDIWVTAR